MINFQAVGIAGFLNSYCMRRSEMFKGIKVSTEEGIEMGVSKKCAEKAVIQTALSRILLSLPTFALPGIAVMILDRMNMIPVHRGKKVALDIFILTIALCNSVPLSVSMFPQRGEIRAQDMEEEFRCMKDPESGEIITKFYYNKGM